MVREKEYGPSSLAFAPPLTKMPPIVCGCHLSGFAAEITAAEDRKSNEPGWKVVRDTAA